MSSSMVGFSDPPPPPPPRPTGANATPLGSQGGSRTAGKEVVDPITQGFDMIRECFERLESRLNRPNPRVAGPVVTEDQDPVTTRQPFGDEEDWELDAHDLGFRRDYYGGDRNPRLGLRNRLGYNRREETGPATGFRGRGGRTLPRRGGQDFHRRGQPPQRTTWDPPRRYREEWDDEDPWDDRGPTNWDPPPRRGGYDRQYHEPPHARSNSSRYSTRRNAYRPPGVLSDYYEPPHGQSNSSRYSARQDAYQSTRNAFTSRDQFVELERPLRQPPPYQPSRSHTGWESQQYVQAIPLGCPPPHAVESRRLAHPYLHYDPSSPSLPVVAAVPPSILTPPALSCCPDVSRDEGELLHDDPPPLAPILQLYNPNISEEDETLIEDKEEDGSISEVEKKIASVNVAQMSSKDVENCGFKRGGACTGVRIIAYIYVDFFDDDVPSIVHRSTSLDADARFIPPRNDTPYLSILGGDRGIRSVVRYAFDPGGDASPKLLLSTLVFGSWFPP